MGLRTRIKSNRVLSFYPDVEFHKKMFRLESKETAFSITPCYIIKNHPQVQVVGE